MSARRRGRRHGGVNEATVASGATATGAGGASGPATEIGRGALADVAAAEIVPVANEASVRGESAGRAGADDAGRPGSAGNGEPRRALRVRFQTPPESPIAPTARAKAAPMAVDESEVRKPACTLAQLRRFIKSRPYVPVHELRRRFLIEGYEDDVSPVATEQGIVYVGLPVEEARFLADLVKAGEVGCELLLDPTSPAVVGVFAMRPIARQ